MLGAVETLVSSLKRSLDAAAAHSGAAVPPLAAAAGPSCGAGGGRAQQLSWPASGDRWRESQADGLSESDLPEGASVNGDIYPLEVSAGAFTRHRSPHMPGSMLQQMQPGATFASETSTPAQRATFQRRLLGALAMLLVDQCCRGPCVRLDPGFDTLFGLLRNDDREPHHHRQHHGLGLRETAGSGTEDAVAWQRQRRVGAARVLTGMMQRSHGARTSLVASGALHRVFNLLNPTEEVSESLRRLPKVVHLRWHWSIPASFVFHAAGETRTYDEALSGPGASHRRR